MNDRPPVVSGTFQLNYLIFFFIFNFFFFDDSDLLEAGLPIVLVEINNSTDRLPLLYSAMKHSTSTKAQTHFRCFFVFVFLTFQ